MRDPIRVLVLGTGQMGSGIAGLVLEKRGLELVGAYGRRVERAGMELAQALGLNQDTGIRISTDLEDVIRQTRPQVAIQATCSKLEEAVEELSTALRLGVHVITIAEEMVYPRHRAAAVTRELQELATQYGVAVMGTGINPGFVLDLLVITLTGVCSHIESITAKRVNDLSPYGPSVLSSQGVGLSPEEFQEGLKDGSVMGHFGFPESIHMIADALGWNIEEIDEKREPILSTVKRETAFATVEAGQVAGCLHTAKAYLGGRAVITLIHPQQIHPHLEGVETGDMIEILGSPRICLAGSPEIPGGQGTVALAVNSIPLVLNAPPGLHCMADLPVPAALLGDARDRVHNAGKATWQ